MKGTRIATERQLVVLRAVVEFIREHNYPPTLREIGKLIGIRSTNGVNDHLVALERKGYIERDQMKTRSITVLRIGEEAVGGTKMQTIEGVMSILREVLAAPIGTTRPKPDDTVADVIDGALFVRASDAANRSMTGGKVL